MKRQKIKITDLYLDVKNPRHETNSQEDAIAWLCNNEKIDELASDIVENGLNPLELIAILNIEKNIWHTLEGNRRVCAIKLLIEPELAPNAKIKKKFELLSSEWREPISELECVSFETREESSIWLDRLHLGEQDGLGRVKWNATQKQRRSDNPENKRALMVLDYALKQGWVSEDAIESKLTTATRYLNNENFRNNIGMGDGHAALTRRRPLNIFNEVLRNFVTDLISSSVDGPVSSRETLHKCTNFG
jgi:hypothetical protein